MKRTVVMGAIAFVAIGAARMAVSAYSIQHRNWRLSKDSAKGDYETGGSRKPNRFNCMADYVVTGAD